MSFSNSIPPSDTASSDESSTRLSIWLAIRVLIVRLRFFLVLLGVLLLVGSWPALRRNWQRLSGAKANMARGMDCDLEFWCPMCPGVVSDWPGKCPVCNMALVRRKKGETVPLPDGALPRMQFSPYRVQLAGIRTAAVEYRSLRREVVLFGLVERSTNSSTASVRAELLIPDLPFLNVGQSVEASVEELPGHAAFRGRTVSIDSEPSASARRWMVQLEIEDPNHDIRSGMLVRARLEAPLVCLPWWRQSVTDEGQRESVADVALHMLLNAGTPVASGGIYSLFRRAKTHVMLGHGYGLAVPCSSVIDHGSRKVVFVETGMGMFDAVEVTVGPRCGDYYPVLCGLEADERVAATGAFLLDAEMWLNHDLAAAYFGASRGAGTKESVRPTVTPPSSSAEEDRLLAAKQKICPVTGEPLDSMGGPVRLVVEGRVVFVCCKGCEGPLRKDPAKYLSKLPAK